jgi:hypothetical protein
MDNAAGNAHAEASLCRTSCDSFVCLNCAVQRSVRIIRVDADIPFVPCDFSYVTRRSEAPSRQVVQVVDHSSVHRQVIKLVPLFRNDA